MRFHVAFKALNSSLTSPQNLLHQIDTGRKKCYQDVLLSIFFLDVSVTARIRWWFDLKICMQKYLKKCNALYNIVLFHLFGLWAWLITHCLVKVYYVQ